MFIEDPFDSVDIVCVLCYEYQFVCFFRLVFPCQGLFSSGEFYMLNMVDYLVLFISSLF